MQAQLNWPVFDCMGRVAPTYKRAPIGVVFQGRAYVNEAWQPWQRISATAYENRNFWPRDNYETRFVVA